MLRLLAEGKGGEEWGRVVLMGLPAAILLARLLRLPTFFESQDIDGKGPRTGYCVDDEW